MVVSFYNMSENSCPSKFIDYLDSFRKNENGVYEYYTLFSTIQLNYVQNELGLMNSPKNISVRVPPPTKPIIESIVPMEKHIDIGKIESIQDLIGLIDQNPYDPKYKYNIDLKSLSSIREELFAIHTMIGMEKLKCNVVDQLLYFIQELHKGNPETPPSPSGNFTKGITPSGSDFTKGFASPTSSRGGGSDFTKVIPPISTGRGGSDFTKGFASPSSAGGGDFTKGIASLTSSGGSGGDFKHTVIYGPPGTGKTEVAKLIGKMYSKIGVLSKHNVFKKVTRNDLVAGYLGQTAIKTKAVITECLGGVLFIDEVYALGNADDLDSFSRECIDTLCEALSDHKDNLMVIIAGYEKEIERHFFSANQGLESRFVWRFTIDKYNPAELRDIFYKKVATSGWHIAEKDTDVAWFTKHKDDFSNYGRDMERLFLYVKIAHSKRVFGQPAEERRKLNDKDMAAGLETFFANRKKDDSAKIKREILTSMYV